MTTCKFVIPGRGVYDPRYCREDRVLGSDYCYIHCKDEERGRVFSLAEFDRIFDNDWPTQGQAYNRLRATVKALDELTKERRSLIPYSRALDAVFKMSNWQHGYGQGRLATTDDCIRCLNSTWEGEKKDV